MSYKLNSPLSEENYNRILTALNTDSDKEFFISLFNEPNINETFGNKVAIRSLSANEYSRYIVNGTCNGSITQNSDYVWHENVYNGPRGIYAHSEYYHEYMINNPTVYEKGAQFSVCWAGIGDSGGFARNTVFTMLVPFSEKVLCFQSTNYVYINCYPPNESSYSTQTNNGSINFYHNSGMPSSILQDNSAISNNVGIGTSKTWTIEGGGFRDRTYMESYNYRNFKVPKCFYSIKKTQTKSDEEITSVGGTVYYSGQQWVILRMVALSCFRPAFTYKDNNKANSIFY